MRDIIRVIEKPLEELSLAELKRERAPHAWAKRKLSNCSHHMTTRLYNLRERKIYTKEEYTKMYKRGEITKGEFMTMPARMSKRRTAIVTCEDCIKYGFDLVDQEAAIIAYIDELISEKKSRQKKTKRKPGTKGKGDPREYASWNNPKRWRGGKYNLRPLRKVIKTKPKWNAITESNKDLERSMLRARPITEWDADKLRKIARARGFASDMTMLAVIAQELRISVGGAKRLIESGKLTWGQTVVIAAFFEMTPVEFCDVFLSGVFKEVVDGKWVAVAENKEALLYEPIKVMPAPHNEDEEGQPLCDDE